MRWRNNVCWFLMCAIITVVQSSKGSGFYGLSIKLLSLPCMLMYFVNLRGNNGSTRTFQSLYCANLYVALKRLDHSLRFFKVYKE